MRKNILDQIDWIGVNDRTTDLFEDFWPLPDGISYNAYFIDDDKRALVDGVKKNFTEELLNNLSTPNEDLHLDYIIINHMEPDHTGSLPTIRRIAPGAEIICTKKAKSMLESFYGITEDVTAVETGDQIDLGSHTLEIIETPFVHWPETMMTYEHETGTLFSGDGFGMFGALDGAIFDGQIDTSEFIDDTIRYFSNIIGAYSATVRAALSKLSSYEIAAIAPAHGLIWRSNPEEIVDIYSRLSNLEADPEVTLIYGSMYGFSESVMESVANGVQSVDGCKLKVIDGARTHPSFCLAESWKRRGLIIGSPTYEARIFTPIDQFVNLAKKKKLKDRRAGFFGSYGWSGGSIRELNEAADELNWDIVGGPVEFNGQASDQKLEEGFELGKSVAEAVLNED